jgi:hypothetical protein
MMTGHVFLYQAKTGTPVLVTVPPDVADELRALPAPPASSARYFFWSGNGTKKSVASMWQRSLKRLFKAAKLKHKDGNRKRAHPRMLLDTFAVELLLVGVAAPRRSDAARA